MRNILRQRLLRRRNVQQVPLVPLCWYERRTHEKIGEDLAADPSMCEPDIKPRITARITRIIQVSTKPLPAALHDAETLAEQRWWWYDDETVKAACSGIDQYATMPMALAEMR